MNIEEILSKTPSKACALLEEYYKEKSDLTKQDSSSFNREQAQQLCDLLFKESEKESVRVENIRVILRLMANVSDHDEAVLQLLSVDSLTSSMMSLFQVIEKFLMNQRPEDEMSAIEARIKDGWEKLFTNFLITIHSLCERVEGKQIFGEKFIPVCVRVVKEKGYDVFVRRHAAECINQMIKHSKENKTVLLQESHLINQLAASLINSGDFTLQANITEVLYRLLSWSNMSDSSLKSVFSCFDELSDKIIVIFKKIKGDETFVECIRSFVMELNDQMSEDKRTVYSIKSSEMNMGSFTCFPEWVDFGTKSMSCFIPQPDDDTKDVVDFEYTNIRTLRLSYKQQKLILQLFNEIAGFEGCYDATKDDQIIGISMTKESLQLIKKNISGLISVCREKNKQKEELLNQPPVPEGLLVTGDTPNSRKVSITAIPLKTSCLTSTPPTDEVKQAVKEISIQDPQEQKKESTKKMSDDNEKKGKKDEREVSTRSRAKSLSAEKKEKSLSSKKRAATTSKKKTKSVEIAPQVTEIPEITTKIGDLLEQVVTSPIPEIEKQRDDTSSVANNDRVSDWENIFDRPLLSLSDAFSSTTTSTVSNSVLDDLDTMSHDTERSPLVPRRLFEEPSEIDTTFGGFNLDDTNINMELEKTPANSKGKKKGTKRKKEDALDDDDDFSSEVAAMMSTIIKKQQEKKNRKIEVMKKSCADKIKKMINDTKKNRLKEREALATCYKQSIQEIEESQMKLAKKMRATYTKFQQDMASYAQKHQELDTRRKSEHELHKERLSLLKTKDLTECSLLEKKVKEEITRTSKEMDSVLRPTETSDKERQLRALIVQLFK
ncbi:hypothetical protein C9374_012769 [Naegleria lovaniensis]|uniref:Uncharacterized protein n=1 Tax=Naegleria lovaniensis TaxID=51637 RepID=A0AA88GCN5_NAELO|nr:uncharacterized protein C9374_012769 [Naegleria lovaniensis]KAG2373167.1 hypothetical protein C9374_012769 [Naegleria lovaniensis]